MVALSLILLQILFLFQRIDGWRYRTPCQKSSNFRCDDGNCIGKNQWCDYSNNCYDNSDEMYCGRGYSRHSCDDTLHFRCKTNDMCIPIEGHCDGYASCADLSDERNCSCEELHDSVGSIAYEAFIGEYRTENRCWKLILKEGQYVNVTIQATFQSRDCYYGNITLVTATTERVKRGVVRRQPTYTDFFNSYDSTNAYDFKICPGTGISHTLTYYDDVEIRYRSSYYTSDTYPKDIFNIAYTKVDRECLHSDAFKCSQNSCILAEKQCDGKTDCENGLDEQNCDFTAFSAAYLKDNRQNVTDWMRSQHTVNWGWKENTHRAVVALYLDNDLTFDQPGNEDELIAKQLELEVSTHLLRSKSDKLSPTEMASYINALLAICHDPKNFYGFDLVQNLKEEIEKVPGYVTPLPWLTLCNAKESIPENVIDSLLKILQTPSDHGFILEVQALSIMALSCISSDERYEHLKENLTETLNDLKLEQSEDGSFGNEYTTALVLQALIANDRANDMDWNFKSSIEFLRRKQKDDGSYGDFLTTYLVMPILNAKSLVDLGKVNCTDSKKRPKDGNLVSDIKSRLGGKIPVKYSLFIGDQKDQIHPIFLRAPENITVLELMTLAADIDPKYTFKTHEIKKKTYVYEILKIPNDPENSKFWFLYHDVGNSTVPLSTQSPDEVYVNENEHIIMWYKTLEYFVEVTNK